MDKVDTEQAQIDREHIHDARSAERSSVHHIDLSLARTAQLLDLTRAAEAANQDLGDFQMEVISEYGIDPVLDKVTWNPLTGRVTVLVEPTRG